MHGGHHQRRERRFDEGAAFGRDLELPAEKRLGRGRAETDDHARLDHGNFGVEPGTAGGDFARVRLLVDPALAARLPLEVLHRVRQIHPGRISAGFDDGLAQEAAGWPDERFALRVFVGTGAFADKQPLGVLIADPKHGFIAPFVQRTGDAGGNAFF